ncbi:uncharacterized protein BDV17DRAFT_157384 [Aspergillus undulatus]|uniref:uncharacterized protein n=1 Tax=Aspergillus undulatus TaxID=1810928 RepID=UPI003CCE44DC
MLKAAPAEAILASSLLRTENSTGHDHARSFEEPPFPSFKSKNLTWDLTLDVEKGLHPRQPAASPLSTDQKITADEGSIFRPGTVIGFSRLRAAAPDGTSSGNEDEFVGELPRHLLTSWLYRHGHSQPQPQLQPKAKAYIIHPQPCTIFSPQALLSSLLSQSESQSNTSTYSKRPPPLNRNEAIPLLDSVTLYPVFDFKGAVDALSAVERELHALAQNQAEQQSRTPQQRSESEPEPEPETQSVLILAGLDTLTESIIRSSNAVRGAAVLGSLLRSVTRLSRSYSHTSLPLSVILVNLSGVGSSPHFSNLKSQHQGDIQAETRDDGPTSTTTINSGAPQTIFSTSAPDTPLFPSLLMKSLDGETDTHLLVSRIGGGRVIEVVKDRTGEGTGRWCVWPEPKAKYMS